MSLPRIACFHGGGSTSKIFETQCTRLQEALKNDFQFVYFDAPFNAPPGAGILPAFAHYSPFKSWFSKDEHGASVPDGSGYDAIGRDGVERVLNLMEEDRSGEGEWVGVLGFSQGTRIAAGLLLDQQRRKKVGEKSRFELRFGVVYMGAYEPMQSEIGHRFHDEVEKVTIPTIHVHGLKDAVLPLSQEQCEKYFDDRTAEVYEIEYHHAMPWNKKDREGLAAKMRKYAQ